MTAPLLDVPLQQEKDVNTEEHLKFSLAKHGVNVLRGDATFLRICAKAGPRCQPIQIIYDVENGFQEETIFAKGSGDQIDFVKTQLLQYTLHLNTRNKAR